MNLLKQIKKIAAVAASSAIVIGSLMPSWQINALDNTVNTKKAENIAADVTTDTSDFDLSKAKKGDGSSYITNAVIEYQSGTDWINVNGAAGIPADARLRVTVNYDSVPADRISDANYTMTYTLPDLLMDAEVTNNTIQNENYQTIGSITASGRTVTMLFDKSHIDSDGVDSINGSFTFSASANQQAVEENPNQTVKIGEIPVNVNFEKDSVARLGDLSISKQTPTYIANDNTSGYLEYSVTVSAGEKAMPSVVVADYLSNESWVFADSAEPYVNVTSSEVQLGSSSSDGSPFETVSDGSSHGTVAYVSKDTALPDGRKLSHAWLRWTIGDMKANETRTLTYRIKLNNKFVGLSANNTIGNTAVPYARSYPHGTDTSNYAPKITVQSEKTAGNVIDNGDTITVPFTVTVTASSTNTWTLNNVKLNDYVTGTNNEITRSILQTYHTSFSDFQVTDEVGKKYSSQLSKFETGRVTSPGFDCYIGDLAPGQKKIITYNMTVDKSILTTVNGDLSINNTAKFFTDDNAALNNYGNKFLTDSKATKMIGSKKWDRKIHGDKLAENTKQTISGGSVYSLQNGVWRQSANQSVDPVSIPEGSYQYQVVVNETGDWDLTSATMRDALGNNYLTYKGYLRLNYYENALSAEAGSDQSAADSLNALTPTKTMWLDVDGLSNLSFVPSQLDNSIGRGAFLLTYYAAPQNISDVSKVSVNNTFTLSGSVIGPGSSTPITIPEGINVNTSVIVDGQLSFGVNKYGWYYDPRTDTDDFNQGILYWVIDVTGTTIPAGLQIIDTTLDNNNTGSLIRGSTVAGIYIGSIPNGAAFTDYYDTIGRVESDYNARANLVRKLSNGENNSTIEYSLPAVNDTVNRNSHRLVVTINKEIHLNDDQHLFLIVRTTPQGNGWGKRTTRTFENSVATKDANSNVETNKKTATLFTNGGGTNFKENVAVMAKDESGWHNLDANGKYSNTSWPITGNGPDKVIQDGITKNGVYLDWHIKINYLSDEEGTVSVTDALPAGVEPVYVRYFWAKKAGLDITIPAITDGRVNNQDWVDIGLKDTDSDIKISSTEKKKESAYAYYNASTNTILFDAANLKKSSTGASSDYDSYSLEVQVLVYVTDEAFNHGIWSNGNAKTKSFTNSMTVTQADRILSRDSATMTVPVPVVRKVSADPKDGKVPFTLTLNPYGADLSKDSDFVTLIDEMGNSLDFDPDSVKVTDSAGNLLINYTAAISDITDSSGNVTGHKLTLVVPDNKKLTVNYDGIIKVQPGVKFNITNKAYWLGYESKITQVNKNNQSYTVGGTSSQNTSPTIKIVKYDANNISRKLSGAIFRIQRVKYQEDTKSWIADPGYASYDQATGDDKNNTTLGEAVFNNSTTAGVGSSFMQFDTVYMITELQAPAGYQRDVSTYLVEIAKRNSDNTYSDLSQDADRGVNVYYGGTIYTQNLYNKKGSLLVTKKFKDIVGKDVIGTDIPDGTYSFGLFNKSSPSATDQPLQTLNIVSQGGSYSYYLTYAGWNLTNVREDQPLFLDLAVGAKFYVYELDENGHAVKQYDSKNPTSSFTAQNGLSYEAWYSNSTNVAVIPDTGNAEVTITNQRHFEYEPVTGVRLTDDKLLSWALVLVIGILLTGLLKRMGKDM